MKAKDLDAWTKQTMELRADKEGQRFLAFFEFWFDTADQVIKQTDGFLANGPDLPKVNLASTSMRAALKVAEAEMGFLTIDWVGQMLAVAAMHWAHGEDMVAGLTHIEHRVLEEAMARKISQLAEAAKMDTTTRKE